MFDRQCQVVAFNNLPCYDANMDSDAQLTVIEVAASLGIQPGAIRDAVARGVIQADRLGGTAKKAGMLLIRRSEMERYRRERLGKRGGNRYTKKDTP